MKQYEEFFELVVLGHNAQLSPEEIHRRVLEAGLSNFPPVSVILRIGRALIGRECRWRPDRPRSWSVTKPEGFIETPKAKKEIK